MLTIQGMTGYCCVTWNLWCRWLLLVPWHLLLARDWLPLEQRLPDLARLCKSTWDTEQRSDILDRNLHARVHGAPQCTRDHIRLHGMPVRRTLKSHQTWRRESPRVCLGFTGRRWDRINVGMISSQVEGVFWKTEILICGSSRSERACLWKIDAD